MADDVRNLKPFDSCEEEPEVFDDITALPLGKDSVTICQLCGCVGRRENFYLRDNKFCSLRCSISFKRKRSVNWRFIMEGSERLEGYIPLEPLPQLQTWPASLHDLQAGPIKQPLTLIANSYEWNEELFGCDFLAAPVSLFKHAPMHDMWDNTFEGMKVEVKNTDCDNDDKNSDYFWVATVIKVKGYMGLFRYEGFGSDSSHDFWVNLCCPEARPVGWCATRGKPLIPPKTIQDKYSDWKKFLVKQLTGARTLPANFYTKLADSLKSRFSVGMVMEVVDKNRISQVKVASIYEIIGKRLHVKYYDSSPEDNGFWCHEDSPLIHPVGWAFRVGHRLDAPPSYCQRVAAGRLQPNDATADMFYKYPTMEPPLFAEGMKLEAIDPLNLSAICAATVMQILNDGYMMIRIDCYPADASAADWFCYHQRSPCIFPVGFSAANAIPIVPPAGWTADEFTWSQYLSNEGCCEAPPSSFAPRTHVVHGFVAGMRLECADLMDPRLVCVATIARVVADLLKVHFDGWGEEYDQWLWAHSTDMYPVGWCRAVGHRLEGPLPPQPRPPRPTKQHKQTRRPKLKRGKVKRHNAGPPQPKINQAVTTEESSQNSDIADTKSYSPPTSASETYADVEGRNDEAKMEVDLAPEEKPEETPVLEQSICDEQQQQTEMVVENQELQQMETDHKSPEPPPPPPPEEISPTEIANDKYIPRLVNNATVAYDMMSTVDPENWSETDVARFLTVNDCQTYCVNFANITGKRMLELSKDEIIELLEMKVGPSLKIFDLIKQLKCKIKTPQSRLLSSFK